MSLETAGWQKLTETASIISGYYRIADDLRAALEQIEDMLVDLNGRAR